MQNIIKRGNLYYPSKEFQQKAWVNTKKIYKEAAKNPLKFWEGQAKELLWRKKWRKVFEHRPFLNRGAAGSYFKWFVDGKLNITENCLDRHLAEKKNKVALIWEPEPLGERPRYLTYYDLHREVNRFANGLKKLGVKENDRVGIYLPMVPELVIAMLACARIGALHAVVFSAFSPQALRVRLQDTKARFLITSDGYYRRGQVINLKQNADEAVKETDVKRMIVVKRAGNDVSWNQKRDLWWDDVIKGQSDWCKAVSRDAEDILFLLYTSGSTGKPKGCVHTCGGYTVQAYATDKWIFDLKDDDIFWSTADVGWITGHTYTVYAPLLNGATSLIFEGAPDFPAPDRWAKIIEKYGVTIFYTAPTAIRMFEKYGADILKPYEFKTLRLLGSVGEPIDEGAWNWYFKEVGKENCPIVDTWWQTETGGILISSLPGLGPFRPTFAGLPFPGLKIDILDDKSRSLPAAKEGNLVILPPFAPGLLRGIWKNSKKYLETYWSQYGRKIYFTSDAAFRDKNGLVRLMGRVDDVLKVAGHRVATGELENAIASHPDIVECAIIGMTDPIKGEVPAAFVVLRHERNGEEIKKEVVSQVMKEIGPIALPKEVFIAPDLPKTRSGKIMRRILKRLFTGEELGDLSTLANPESVEAVRKIIKVKS